MIKIHYDRILSIINEKTGLSKDEIESKINEKLGQLSGLISKEGAAHIIANELKVPLVNQSEDKDTKINDIFEGMKNITVSGKVINIYEVREFQVSARSGKVGTFIMGDDTGTIRTVCWGNMCDEMKEIKQGDIVKVVSCYARKNNDNIEIHVNENSQIMINPEGISIENVQTVSRTQQAMRKKISDLTEGNAEIFGFIVQVFEPKYYEICGTCAKRMKEKVRRPPWKNTVTLLAYIYAPRLKICTSPGPHPGPPEPPPSATHSQKKTWKLWARRLETDSPWPA
jgi:hypothetical protein